MICSKYSSTEKYPCVYVGADRLWNFLYGFTFLHFRGDKWKRAHYIIRSGNTLLRSNLVVSTYCVQLHRKKLPNARAASFSGGARHGWKMCSKVLSGIQYMDWISPLHTHVDSYIIQENVAASLPDTSLSRAPTLHCLPFWTPSMKPLYHHITFWSPS